MLSEGSEAPAVSLPAYVDGERRRLDLDEYLGEGIVVLAFYPADFNPACTMQESDLGDLDLFTMQKDVSVFAVSPDSTYSHEAFAERYGLHVPLLSDPERRAAEAYGVTTETEIGEGLVRRAVFVVDHRGTVRYAWSTDDLAEEIDAAPVKQAVGDVGGDDTALERYRVGHDHYAGGREAFTTAMADYEDREWMDARNGFEAAEPEFTAAADHFDTAVRFAETADFETVVDRTEEKADTLSHAASWLADSAAALASGRGKQGAQYREDAQRLLDAATDLAEPPDPDAFAPTDDGIDLGESVVVHPDEDEGYDWRADDADAVDTDLGVDDADLDAAVAGEGDGDGPSSAAPGSDVEGDTVEGDLEMDLDAVDAAAETDSEGGDETGSHGDGEANPGGSDADGPTAAADRRSAESTPVYRGGSRDESSGPPSTDPAAGGTAGGPPGGNDAGGGSETDGAESAAEPEADGDSDDDADDADEDVEELDLVDPTEAEEEDDAEPDERADWDIPGR